VAIWEGDRPLFSLISDRCLLVMPRPGRGLITGNQAPSPVLGLALPAGCEANGSRRQADPTCHREETLQQTMAIPCSPLLTCYSLHDTLISILA
jgi:hypothetical protein